MPTELGDVHGPAASWTGQQCRRKCTCAAWLLCHTNAGCSAHLQQPPAKVALLTSGMLTAGQPHHATRSRTVPKGDGWSLGTLGSPVGRSCGPTVTSLNVTADSCELDVFVKPQLEILHDGWSPGALLLCHSTLTQACAAACGAVHPCPIPRASTSAQAASGDRRTEAHPTPCAAPCHWCGDPGRAHGQRKRDGCSTFVCGHEMVPAKGERQLSL